MKIFDIYENRQNRLLAFFDAVLAIAITVLALQIDIPELGKINNAARYEFFIMLTSYFMSFIAMGSLWYLHNNFFSNHNIMNNKKIYVWHLALLFVITLFFFFTKAISQYPDDAWLKAIYIGVLLCMHGLTILIFVLTKQGERKNQKYVESARNIFQDAGGNLGDYKNEEWDRILRITYAVQNPDEIMEMAIKKFPSEYLNLLNELKEDSENSYRISVISSIIMALSITLAVIVMMVSPFMCYVILFAGMILTLIAKIVFKKKKQTASFVKQP